MRINLITQEEHDFIAEAFKNTKGIVYQNVGYNYPKIKEEDQEVFKKIEAILSKSITGFRRFNHLRLSQQGKKQIRFQYNYNYDNDTMPYEGVGYILLDELLNGFKPEKNDE